MFALYNYQCVLPTLNVKYVSQDQHGAA